MKLGANPCRRVVAFGVALGGDIGTTGEAMNPAILAQVLYADTDFWTGLPNPEFVGYREPTRRKVRKKMAAKVRTGQYESGSDETRAKLLNDAAATYSGDTIMNSKGGSKIRGIFQYDGRMWVCTGYAGTGANGPLIVNLQEVLPHTQWKERTFTYSEACAKDGTRTRGEFYAGIPVTYKGREYVLGRETLDLDRKENLEAETPKDDTPETRTESETVIAQVEHAPEDDEGQQSLVIPGMKSAAAEAHDTQASLDGERLSLFIKTPPSREIDADKILAGPLFRGTAASPQAGLFQEE